MILTIEEIRELLENPRNEDKLKKACKLYDKMNMLLNGKNISRFLDSIQGFENKDQYEIRMKRARSAKDVYANILSPVDKIFSAKGTYIDYQLKGKQKEEFIRYLSKIRDNVGVKKWLNDNWKDRLHYDPNGLIFIEVDEKGENPYPTYKNVKSLYDIGNSGQLVDYVIFQPCKIKDEFEIYRVVDDAYDYSIKRYQNGEIEIIEDEEIEGKRYTTIENLHGKVPAILIGDIKDPNDDIMVTPIDKSVEIAMEYVVDCSIHSVHKLMHGFPLYWEYFRQCEHCKGSGVIEGNSCQYCRGTGAKIRKDVSEKLVVPLPEEGDPVITPDVAGVVEPAITTWQEIRVELEWLQKGMEQASWGTHRNENAENETATARYLDIQPVYDKLNKYSDSLEVVYKFIVDTCGRYMYESYQGSTINFGRRFNIESPDAIIEKYNKARTSGTPVVILNYMIDQYVQSEFARDAAELQKQIKLIDIEPWKHYTITEVTDFNLPEEEYKKKLYYGEWVSTLTNEYILDTPIEKMQNDFFNYIKGKENGQKVQ